MIVSFYRTRMVRNRRLVVKKIGILMVCSPSQLCNHEIFSSSDDVVRGFVLCLQPHRHHHNVTRERRQNHNPKHYFVEGGEVEDLGEWGAWTPAGECSRSCGGGVGYETRECYSIRYINYKFTVFKFSENISPQHS